MRKIIFFFILNLAFAYGAFAQVKYEYSYDNSGNRIVRQIIDLKRVASSEDSSTQVFQQGSIKVFPNPVQDYLKVDLGENVEDEVSISIVDINGKIIRQFSTKQRNTTLDISSLSQGVYYFTVKIKGDKKNWKIIKNK